MTSIYRNQSENLKKISSSYIILATNIVPLTGVHLVWVIINKYTRGSHSLNSALLWEYDLSAFDWQASRALVVQRVIELGTPEDFYAAFYMYGGVEGFREILKDVPYFSPIDLNFVSFTFNLKKEE